MPFTEDVMQAAGYLNRDVRTRQVHVGDRNVESIKVLIITITDESTGRVSESEKRPLQTLAVRELVKETEKLQETARRKRFKETVIIFVQNH